MISVPSLLTLTPALIDTLRWSELARVMALASGAGGMRIVSGTFSVSHRPVGQVIFARRLARTYAVSGKSPMRSADTAVEKFPDFGVLGD